MPTQEKKRKVYLVKFIQQDSMMYYVIWVCVQNLIKEIKKYDLKKYFLKKLSETEADIYSYA